MHPPVLMSAITPGPPVSVLGHHGSIMHQQASVPRCGPCWHRPIYQYPAPPFHRPARGPAHSGSSGTHLTRTITAQAARTHRSSESPGALRRSTPMSEQASTRALPAALAEVLVVLAVLPPPAVILRGPILSRDFSVQGVARILMVLRSRTARRRPKRVGRSTDDPQAHAPSAKIPWPTGRCAVRGGEPRMHGASTAGTPRSAQADRLAVSARNSRATGRARACSGRAPRTR